jgi:PAS domain-containing protein
MEYQTLTKAELVKILEGIRSPRYGRGEPADLQNIRILEALLLERYELQAHIQSLKDSFARLDESLSDYLELFESAPVGYIVLDVGACIVKMNPSAGALLRRDRTTVVGLSFPLMLADIFSSADASRTK